MKQKRTEGSKFRLIRPGDNGIIIKEGREYDYLDGKGFELIDEEGEDSQVYTVNDQYVLKRYNHLSIKSKLPVLDVFEVLSKYHDDTQELVSVVDQIKVREVKFNNDIFILKPVVMPQGQLYYGEEEVVYGIGQKFTKGEIVTVNSDLSVLIGDLQESLRDVEIAAHEATRRKFKVFFLNVGFQTNLELRIIYECITDLGGNIAKTYGVDVPWKNNYRFMMSNIQARLPWKKSENSQVE